jgi:beta-glucosidase
MTTEAHLPALRELVDSLDLETKVRLVTGAGVWWTAEDPSIGLSPLVMADGPVGVRGPIFSDARVAANLPSSSALAASWDDDLLLRAGQLLAVEATRQGADVVLGPTINLHRSPLGGRHFECFSEDPHLTGRLATAYVRGLQDSGVGACPKHFVANDAETERTTVDNRIDERTLRELYLAPFEAVVADASPWSIMAAYNGVNGAPMSENPLLAETLKGEWGWDGLVVSDWGGIYSTIDSARAAIDLAMGGPEPLWCQPLLDAVRAGEVDEAALDDKIERLLRLAERVGALKGRGEGGARPAVMEAAAAGPFVREAAAAGTVLLANDGILPLQPGSLRRVALIGSSALEPRAQGGGSAMVFPPYVVRPQEALTRALGQDVEIVTTVGAQLREVLRPPFAEELEGTVVRWLAPDGALLAEESPATSFLYRSIRAIYPGSSSVEIATRFIAPSTSTWRLGVSGPGSFELELDGLPALSETFVRDRMDMGANGGNAPQSSVLRDLAEGQIVEVLLRYRWAEDFLIFGAGFGVAAVLGAEDDEINRAVDLARDADVAIVLVGTSEAVESEGFDRSDLQLPGRQDDLVSAVAAVNPRTVVVVNAGSPVEMPWRDHVAALLVTWFPGMEMGNALTDVLLGAAEPGGRLPTTWPADLASAPVVTVAPTDGVLTYDEGVHIGYRAYLRTGTTPAYWFGYGLGYTSWDYESLETTATAATVRVRNTGERPGKQVVQVYVSRPDSTLDRPAVVLAGYAVVRAEAGEAVQVTVPIDPRVLRHWDVARRCWSVEPGTVLVHTGPHAGDLPLQATTVLVQS